MILTTIDFLVGEETNISYQAMRLEECMHNILEEI